MTKLKFILFYGIIIFAASIAAQPKSNLDIIYDLAEDNVSKLLINLPHETDPFTFNYSSLPEYASFENRFVYHLSGKGLIDKETEQAPQLNYSLDKIEVDYSEPFRGGFLSDYKVERNVLIQGTFSFENNNKILNSGELYSSYSDTLFYSEINEVESIALRITHGTKPPEPVFESLLEPVIAVGAVVVSIILLFTVRSK